MDIKIIIATHKKYEMPRDSIYLPLHVGAEGKGDLGYARDNTGENISSKNPSFCELTGLYWAWKNLDADYIGLVHYRRHFAGTKRGGSPFERILTKGELQHMLSGCRIFVPEKRRYYIESLYSHYQHTHYEEHLNQTRELVAQMYSDYLPSYDRVMKRTYGYMFNMMIMERRLLNEYCTWLFDILFALEKRSSMSSLSAFQGRFYGRVSEIIFNVRLDYQLEHGRAKRSEVKELPVVYTEKVNWRKKILAFLKAKFFHKKYEGSF